MASSRSSAFLSHPIKLLQKGVPQRPRSNPLRGLAFRIARVALLCILEVRISWHATLYLVTRHTYSFPFYYIHSKRLASLLGSSSSLSIILSLQLIMLQDIHHLPRIIHPHIRDIHPCEIRNPSRDLCGLFLELVVDDEDAEFGGFCESGAFGGVLDEGELGGDVFDEFFQGVSVGRG